MSKAIVVIIDDEAAAFLEQQGVNDPSAYVNNLLETEKDRISREKPSSNDRHETRQEIIRSTPDASGYPELKQNFQDQKS